MKDLTEAEENELLKEAIRDIQRVCENPWGRQYILRTTRDIIYSLKQEMDINEL